MQNDLKYTVRSREIVDLVTAMRTSRLTLSPYFQRNLVWRDAHKRDFIETIHYCPVNNRTNSVGYSLWRDRNCMPFAR